MTDEERKERRRAQKREHMRRYCAANPEKAKAERKAYYDAHKKDISEWGKRYRSDPERAEQLRVKCRAWHASNRDRKKTYLRAQYKQKRDTRLAYAAEYRQKNRQKLRDRQRNFANNNKAIISERFARWAAANPQWRKAYQKTHAARYNARSARRRAALFQAMPTWADIAAIESVYREAARLTKSTGIRHEVDHIVPLDGKIVCGLHVAWNLRVITHADNRSKGNRLMPHLIEPPRPQPSETA